MSNKQVKVLITKLLPKSKTELLNYDPVRVVDYITHEFMSFTIGDIDLETGLGEAILKLIKESNSPETYLIDFILLNSMGNIIYQVKRFYLNTYYVKLLGGKKRDPITGVLPYHPKVKPILETSTTIFLPKFSKQKITIPEGIYTIGEGLEQSVIMSYDTEKAKLYNITSDLFYFKPNLILGAVFSPEIISSNVIKTINTYNKYYINPNHYNFQHLRFLKDLTLEDLFVKVFNRVHFGKNLKEVN